MNKLILVFVFIFSSCSSSVHLVNMSDFDTKEKFTSGKWVQVEATQKVIMGFKFDTNYVNQAKTDLIAKCEDGDIQGITTRYSTDHGFFHWINKINMQGLCLK